MTDEKKSKTQTRTSDTTPWTMTKSLEDNEDKISSRK
jgi:hypothetical protein